MSEIFEFENGAFDQVTVERKDNDKFVFSGSGMETEEASLVLVYLLIVPAKEESKICIKLRGMEGQFDIYIDGCGQEEHARFLNFLRNGD